MKITVALLAVIMLLPVSSKIYSETPRRDKGQFIEYTNETWEKIKKDIEDYEKKETPKKKTFFVDFSNFNIPKSIDECKPVWHNKPVMQSSTGTCWAFASTSFLESEVYRQHKKEVKLSEMHTVYYEYLAKVSRYVTEHGNSLVSEGSQTNATVRIMKEYGAVPVSVYSGLKEGQTHHAHEKMITEINTYLEQCKKNSFWVEEEILKNVRTILNYYMNEPPKSFTYEGKNYTPKSFLSEYLQIKPEDYVDLLSLMEAEYWKKSVYDVPDNWWKSNVYHNVPVNDFMTAINSAIDNGYSMAIGGDVSESGMYSYEDAAVVPSFDIPSEYIDDNAREFRFANHTTTDDHAIHLVGKTKNSSGDWFLIKDSGSGARNGKQKGYYFFHSDYIKLKIMTFMVHKDAVPEILKKFDSKL